MRLKKTVYFLVFMLVFSLNTMAQRADKYIAKHRAQAKELSIEFGIPSSVILGVAILESGGGNGWIAKNLHNHFGVVGKNHHPRNSRYKQYNSNTASFRHFCEVIAAKSFYEELKYNYDADVWIDAISKSGYSEEPVQWKEKVLAIIDSNNLKY